VVAYQTALKASLEDPLLWEGLGAAYQGLGRGTAALKSYIKALELAPGRLYCLLQSGTLLYQLGQHDGEGRGQGCSGVLCHA
jgi:superkiller protein 3